MKMITRSIIVLVALIVTACSDDNGEKELTSRELLLKYNWIVFSVEWDVGPGPIPEPDFIPVVLNFNETSYSGSDYSGDFYEFGAWSLEADILTMSEDESQVIEISRRKLVYEAPDGAVITRLPIKKGLGI